MHELLTKIRKFAGIISLIASLLFLITLLLPAIKSSFYIKDIDYLEVKTINYWHYVVGGTSMNYDFNIWGLITYLAIIGGGIISFSGKPSNLFWGSLLYLASCVFFIFTKTIFLSFHELTYISDLYKAQVGVYLTAALSFILFIFNLYMSFYIIPESKKNKR